MEVKEGIFAATKFYRIMALCWFFHYIPYRNFVNTTLKPDGRFCLNFHTDMHALVYEHICTVGASVSVGHSSSLVLGVLSSYLASTTLGTTPFSRPH
jgi:hypothetical protein